MCVVAAVWGVGSVSDGVVDDDCGVLCIVGGSIVFRS